MSHRQTYKNNTTKHSDSLNHIIFYMASYDCSNNFAESGKLLRNYKVTKYSYKKKHYEVTH